MSVPAGSWTIPDPPTFEEVDADLAERVETSLHELGRPRFAEQVRGLRVRSVCTCAPRCSAFNSVPLSERGGRLSTGVMALNEEARMVIVAHIDGLVVGLDILDSGEVRSGIERAVAARALGGA